MYSKFLVLLVCLSIFLPSSSIADVPQTISYQGVLTDDAGAVVPDGDYNITFSLYTVASGGTALWQETQSVKVLKGIFNVELGILNPISLDFDNTYYLGISVDGGTELTPRVKLNSVPYSLNADKVKADNIFPSKGYAGIGTNDPDFNLHIVDNKSGIVGIRIENPNTGTLAIEGISFVGDDGKLAGMYAYSESSPYSHALNIFNSRTSGYIQFRTNGVERVRIASNGNVGVGNANPLVTLDVGGGVRIGNTTGTIAGTIRWTGTDFEGYDGSSWKSLTASGGGNLPPGTAGQTLRHTGSGWIATSSLYNNGTRVGIGTTTPDARLDILGGNWDLNTTDGDLKIGNDTYKLKIGVATGGAGAGSAGIRVQGGLERLILGGGSNEVMAINGDGSVEIGSSTVSGTLKMKNSGYSSTDAVRLYSDVVGGQFDIFDENGVMTAYLHSDHTGEGGYFRVEGSSDSWFVVDGHNIATGELKVSIGGSSSSMTFDGSVSGDNSLMLPNSSVSSVEILNEPGIASVTDFDVYVHQVSNSSVEDIKTCTITVPAEGYVLVTVTCGLRITHVNGTHSQGYFGVSNQSATFPDCQDLTVWLPSDAVSGTYDQVLNVHGVFHVIGGVNTFYFVGMVLNGTMSVADLNMTCCYFPTAYGSAPTATITYSKGVDETEVASGPADAEAEKEKAIKANLERIQKELEEMQRKFERLREEVEKEALKENTAAR